MVVLQEEIRHQIEIRTTALAAAASEGDDLQVAILRAEIEDLQDLARRHSAEEALGWGGPEPAA